MFNEPRRFTLCHPHPPGNRIDQPASVRKCNQSFLCNQPRKDFLRPAVPSRPSGENQFIMLFSCPMKSLTHFQISLFANRMPAHNLLLEWWSTPSLLHPIRKFKNLHLERVKTFVREAAKVYRIKINLEMVPGKMVR